MSLTLDAAQISQLQAKLDAADYAGAETLPARQLPSSATACPFRCHGITGHGSATRPGPTCSIASNNTIHMARAFDIDINNTCRRAYQMHRRPS